MKPFYVTYKYKYPIYLYLEEPNLIDPPNNEIHVQYTDSRGSCKNVACEDCPIIEECNSNTNLLRLLPKEDFIELFI